MKRSEINRLQQEALSLIAEHRFALPPFVTWDEVEWKRNPETAQFCRLHQMGWDITDFGSSDFIRRGLVIICLRNGIQGISEEKPYAEKLLIVRENQETPFHCHRIKMEDIIVRGGGNLVLELRNGSADGRPADTPVTVLVDGARLVIAAGEPLRLQPGQSATVTRNLWHRFYGEVGSSTVFVGEVSQVNDDFSDNYFLEDVGRFAGIVEDEPKLFPLWNELSAVGPHT